MAYQIGVLDVTFTADDDLRAKQHHLVAMVGPNAVNTVGGAGPTIGGLQNKPDKGEAASVRIFGITKIVSASVTASGELIANNNGKGSPAGPGDFQCGMFLEDAGAADEVITAAIQIGNVFLP